MGTIPKLEDCNPGFAPVEYNVIIAPETAESVSKGGIILTDAIKETEGMAKVWGLLVSASPFAFNYQDTWPENFAPPQPGEQVLYAKYGGTLVTGADGVEYRVLKDKDIALVRRV